MIKNKKHKILEKRICKCGCNKEFICNINNKKMFIQGHNASKKAYLLLYGKKVAVKKIVEMHKKTALKKTGKKLTDKQKENLAKSHKGQSTLKWFIKKFGEKQGRIKYKMRCEKISLFKKGKTDEILYKNNHEKLKIVKQNRSKAQSRENNPSWVKREIRHCICGCEQTFECRINSKQLYIKKHKPNFLFGKTYEEIYGIEKANQLKKDASIRRVDAIINKTYNINSNHKHGYFFSKLNNKELYYRSSFELAAYIFLDDEISQSIIKSWDVECFSIPYFDENGQLRRTIPDIFVEYKSGKKQIINVKPFDRLEEIGNILRHQACDKYAQENNMVHSIWTEKELGISNDRYRELLEIHENQKISELKIKHIS
jgi:hypothetical protein